MRQSVRYGTIWYIWYRTIPYGTREGKQRLRKASFSSWRRQNENPPSECLPLAGSWCYIHFRTFKKPFLPLMSRCKKMRYLVRYYLLCTFYVYAWMSLLFNIKRRKEAMTTSWQLFLSVRDKTAASARPRDAQRRPAHFGKFIHDALRGQPSQCMTKRGLNRI